MALPTRPVAHAAIATTWGQAVHDWGFTPFGFQVHGGTVSTPTSMTKQDLATADDDPGSWLDAANKQVVAPANSDGLYLAVVRMTAASGTAGEYVRAKLVQNSTDLGFGTAVSAGGTTVGLTLTDIIVVTAGDTVSVYAQKVGAGANPQVTIVSFQMIRLGGLLRVMTYYINQHVSQFDGSAKQGQNCTPASGSNAALAVTGGTFKHTAGWWRGLVKPSEETSPLTPGWSLADLDLAMERVHIGFEVKAGLGWAALLNWRAQGHYIVLQGDSEEFGSSTCSGAFNGDHCIGVHPYTYNNLWRIDDPICKAGRYESPGVIRAYAENYYKSVSFGITTGKVPQVVWGSDVPNATRAPDGVGNRVRAAITLTGHNPGALVNIGDLERALERAHHDYGSVVGAGDVQWLLDWAARQ